MYAPFLLPSTNYFVTSSRLDALSNHFDNGK
jgi:hypothetical protein